MILDFQTLPELLVKRVAASPEATAFSESTVEGQWVGTSWESFHGRVEAAAISMWAHGVRPGDSVGLMLPNGLAWEILHHASLRLGAVVVGCEKADPAERLLEIFDNAAMAAVFTDDPASLSFLPAGRLEALKIAVDLTDTGNNAYTEIPGWLGWGRFASSPRDAVTLPPLPQPDQAATLIYTSGTTGRAKGICYSHGQLAMAAKSVVGVYGAILSEQTRFICWLPLTALTQRVANVSGIILAAQVFILADPRNIMAAIKSVSPGFFLGVPRFYEKLWQGINDQIAGARWPMRMLVKLAIGIGGVYARNSRQGKRAGWWLARCHGLADRFVLSRIRSLFGQDLKYMVSGSAPIAVHLLEFYHAIGIVILEAYGLSENIVPMAANRHDAFSFGSVGRLLEVNEVVHDNETAMFVRGPGVFGGYHREDASAARFVDGFFDTGDFGVLRDGFLTLKGRRSELIKTSTGRRIAPVQVEDAIRRCLLIDQAVVFGSGHKRLIAVLTLNAAAIEARYPGGHWKSQPPAFLAELEAGLSAAVGELPPPERPAGYIVLEHALSIVAGELTASLKLRRMNIEKRYARWMNGLFAQVDESDASAPAFIFLFEAQIRQAQFADLPIQIESISSRSARAIRFGAMAAKIGWIGMSASLPHLDLGDASRERRATAARQRIGRVLTAELSTLKGPAAKVGQMASYAIDAVPASIRETLAMLQSTSFPLADDRIRGLVEKSLGRPIDAVFSQWQSVPLAVGTMSQVHLAQLTSGEQVVVKVLHPDSRQVVSSDLALLKFIFPLIGKRIGASNGAELLQELYELFTLECDLRREAGHQELFRRLLADDPQVVVPKVFWDATSHDVLTMEYVSGVSYQQFKEASDQPAKNRAAETIFRATSAALCHYGIFNADPHPGNYLFVDDKVCFLDFGFVRRWPREFIDIWKRQSLAGGQGDVVEFERASVALGFSGVTDFNLVMKQFRAISYEPWREDRGFQFTPSFLSAELKGLFDYGSLPPFRMPPEYVALSRLFTGQYAVLADLQAEANWNRILRRELGG